ncbi:RNA polymerase Rpb4 family protein [Methanobrevibacter filiformis]|uniref:DNA-directed RNA polymerase subunit Rpo4 n=1 Tax=Methanobrevibacter filiformis TaxID=55758 RepID=A0A166CXG4_9EURY|nr:RNA polymerase Rpb4 family protein [Methanobrevibacter filiformis]KZX17447.1 RNA polymerase Rpb4 [Methanobrevibacter filiformis]
MIGKKVVESKPVPMAKVKTILEDFQEEFELSYEQNLTLDHVTKFSKDSLENTEKLVEELEQIVKTKYAIRIADLMPQNLSDLRLLFAKERTPITKETLEKILEILDKYSVE